MPSKKKLLVKSCNKKNIICNFSKPMSLHTLHNCDLKDDNIPHLIYSLKKRWLSVRTKGLKQKFKPFKVEEDEYPENNKYLEIDIFLQKVDKTNIKQILKLKYNFI